jgi:hypothetical protein
MVNTQDDYQRCRYSITCYTDDLAVVHCLRALCHYAEKNCRGQIGWGGTGEKQWREAGNQITLRFTSPTFREEFILKAKRLLPLGCWRETGQNDSIPRLAATRLMRDRVNYPLHPTGHATDGCTGFNGNFRVDG